jgi:armadillo repeat-containing protein 8
VDSGLGMDILKIVLGRELGEKSGMGTGNTSTKGKEGVDDVAGEKDEDDAMEGIGDDEMKSSKVVKGLGEDRRVIGAALAAVCNILTDFSPLRPVSHLFIFFLSLKILRPVYLQIYLEEKLMPRLIYIMKESGDPSLRLSALWAVKNVLRKTSTETKRDVMSHLGWPHLVEYVFIITFRYFLAYALFFQIIG